MWINDDERESGGRDVKSGKVAVDCVAGAGAVAKSERSTVSYICHPTLRLGTKRQRKKEEGKEKERNI